MVSLRSLPPNVTMSLVNGQHRIMALLSLLEDAQSLANQEAEDSNGARIAAPTAEVGFSHKSLEFTGLITL